MEACGHCADCGYAVGAGDGAVQCMAGAVPDLSGRGLADRRFGRRAMARRARGSDVGLLVRARLFRAGTLLDRLRLSRRCTDLRLAMPFAVLGLPAYLALFIAFGFALARLLWTRDASRVLALAISLTVAEWLRGHVLSGFPWNASVTRCRSHWRWRDRFADRAVGHDVRDRCDLREPGGSDRRQVARTQVRNLGERDHKVLIHKVLDRTGDGADRARRHGH